MKTQSNGNGATAVENRIPATAIDANVDRLIAAKAKRDATAKVEEDKAVKVRVDVEANVKARAESQANKAAQELRDFYTPKFDPRTAAWIITTTAGILRVADVGQIALCLFDKRLKLPVVGEGKGEVESLRSYFKEVRERFNDLDKKEQGKYKSKAHPLFKAAIRNYCQVTNPLKARLAKDGDFKIDRWGSVKTKKHVVNVNARFTNRDLEPAVKE